MPSGLIRRSADTTMTLPDHQVHGWIASLVDRTADQLRADLALLVRQVQDAPAAQDIARAEGPVATPLPGSEPAAIHAAVSASPDQERYTGLSLPADLLDAVTALDDARSLTEILNVLVDRASIHAGRLLLVVARGDALIGWRWHGYSGDPADAATLVIGPEDQGLVMRAARSGSTETGRTAATDQMGIAAENQTAVAVPLRVDGHVVAVLYMDAHSDAAVADTEPEAEPDAAREHAAGLGRGPWPDVIDVLARHAARCLECMTARRLHELVRLPAAGRTGEAVQAG